MRTATGKERPRVTSVAEEDKFIRVTSLRNCNPNKCFRVQVTHLNINCSETLHAEFCKNILSVQRRTPNNVCRAELITN